MSKDHSVFCRFVDVVSLEPSDSRVFASGEAGIGFEEPDRSSPERRERFESAMFARCRFFEVTTKYRDITLLQ